MSEDVPANSVLFSNFCLLLESLHKKKRQRQEQDRILINFINDLRLKVAEISSKKNGSFFPILRLLLPDRDRDRGAYNMKESKLGDLLVSVLGWDKQSQNAKKLTQFRSVQNSKDSDFAGVAFFLLKTVIGQNQGCLTIGDVNTVLDKIASAEVGNKRVVLEEAFTYVIRNTSAEQLKWFLRIILKDLKLAMGTNRILAAFHPDAPDLYESCGKLSKVCEDLEDGNTRPVELGIQVFFAVSPMLSERFDVTQLHKLSPTKTYQIETKFDGERFQVHMQNEVFEYFSKKGYSYADTYGKTYEAGLLTPLLKNCFSPSVTSFVLDGEMMGWHKYHQCFGSKGMAFDVKKITEKSKFRPCFCAFDLLLYNGKTLVGPPDKGGITLSERLKLLHSMFTDIPGVLQHSKRQIVNDNCEILSALNKAIENQEEGIVLKDTESYYIANRRNAGWYKIKPEYTENTMSDLDLVIIGADEAENNRQGRARSFHVACADSVAPGEPAHRWLCVGKVSTGVKFEERQTLCAALEKHWVPYAKTPAPASLHFNDKPDFWILPEHSVVLQIRATELIRSSDFATEYTLRFPWIVRIRDDKPVKDTMTLEEFKKLIADKGPIVKLATKRINEEQVESTQIKTRKTRVKSKLQVFDPSRVKRTDDETVEVKSKALLGRRVCILSGDEDCPIPELTRIVESHGGKCVRNIGSNTWCSVAGRRTHRIKKLIKCNEVELASTNWLRNLPPSDALCELSPLDMLSTSTATKLRFCRTYDRFGDSYTELVNEDVLRKCFDRMEDNEPKIYLTRQEILDLDKELFGDNNPHSFLRSCFIHIPDNESLNCIRAKMYGATICDIQSPNLTHVLVSSKDLENVVSLKKSFNALFVHEEWLTECLLNKKLVPEGRYLL